MNRSFKPNFLFFLESIDGLDVLDANGLHVLRAATVDVPVRLLDCREGVVLPEVRVDWNLEKTFSNIYISYFIFLLLNKHRIAKTLFFNYISF